MIKNHFVFWKYKGQIVWWLLKKDVLALAKFRDQACWYHATKYFVSHPIDYYICMCSYFFGHIKQRCTILKSGLIPHIQYLQGYIYRYKYYLFYSLYFQCIDIRIFKANWTRYTGRQWTQSLFFYQVYKLLLIFVIEVVYKTFFKILIAAIKHK